MTAPAAPRLCDLRQVVPHTCPVCGTAFQALKTAKFCSNRCRQAAKYQRSKAARAAIKEESK